MKPPNPPLGSSTWISRVSSCSFLYPLCVFLGCNLQFQTGGATKVWGNSSSLLMICLSQYPKHGPRHRGSSRKGNWLHGPEETQGQLGSNSSSRSYSLSGIWQLKPFFLSLFYNGSSLSSLLPSIHAEADRPEWAWDSNVKGDVSQVANRNSCQYLVVKEWIQTHHSPLTEPQWPPVTYRNEQCRLLSVPVRVFTIWSQLALPFPIYPKEPCTPV